MTKEIHVLVLNSELLKSPYTWYNKLKAKHRFVSLFFSIFCMSVYSL